MPWFYTEMLHNLVNHAWEKKNKKKITRIGKKKKKIYLTRFGLIIIKKYTNLHRGKRN
jgi:hypothetical protein